MTIYVIDMYKKGQRRLLAAFVLLFLISCGIPGSSPLIVSIRSGDLYSVQSFIDSGEDVNELSYDFIDNRSWRVTPLISASVSGNLEIVKILLDAGADINKKDELGQTPLMAAVAKGHYQLTLFLIKNGSDVNLSRPDKTTALMMAALYHRNILVETLLDAGADPNIGIESGETALSIAVHNGNSYIVEDLLKNGAVITELTSDRAKQKKDKKIFDLFEDHSIRNNERNTYIEILEPTFLSWGGEVQSTLSIGDTLVVLKTKKCRDKSGMCWKVKNIDTGERGFVGVNRMKSYHRVYSSKDPEITNKNDQPSLHLSKYIELKSPVTIKKHGKIPFTVYAGETLEVIGRKTCGKGGECWVVREINTENFGTVKADSMRSLHHVYEAPEKKFSVWHVCEKYFSVINKEPSLDDDQSLISYIKIGKYDKFWCGDVKYCSVSTGDILEVLEKHPCEAAGKEYWKVYNILTGTPGYIPVDRVQSYHYEYRRKGRYPFQVR